VRILRVDSTYPDPVAIAEAAQVIRHGGIVAFPTETVYGLGGNVLDPDAIGRIYAAKGRPSYNPLIVHCADTAAARELAIHWPPEAETLATIYWPGPLTMVVRKNEKISDNVTASLPTVALRVPSHPVAAALLAASGVPIAAPSANRFTELSPTTAEHVAKGLRGRIDILLDGGPAGVGIESTVVDLSGSDPVLLRPGSIDIGRLETAIGRPLLSPAVYTATAARPGPGMTDRHYAPTATLVLVPPGDLARLATLADRYRVHGTSVAALLRTPTVVAGIERIVQMPIDPANYARVLYATLHQLDDERFDVILVEAPPPGSDWAAVADRLRRAATSA
jgi:L-threonylcarbamoyladenylate synthase